MPHSTYESLATRPLLRIILPVTGIPFAPPNSDAGPTPHTQRKPRARAHATYNNGCSVPYTALRSAASPTDSIRRLEWNAVVIADHDSDKAKLEPSC
jgi:hypothetical protein